MVLSKEQRDFIKNELERGMINEVAKRANVSRMAVYRYFTMKSINNEAIENAILSVYGELKKRRSDREIFFKNLLNG